jgi:hypothetical protein
MRDETRRRVTRILSDKSWRYPLMPLFWGFVVINLATWINLFRHTAHRQPSGTGLLAYDCVTLAILIVVVIILATARAIGMSRRMTLALVVLTFSTLLQVFSYQYWSYGTARNFNHPLTHLDALYFTLGTLTTAGTGNLVAISETARRIQTLQMFLDLALVVFALGLIFVRFSSHAEGATRSRSAPRK